jgi:hypothetical protein
VPQVAEHVGRLILDPDPAIPPDHNGRRGCTCGLMGRPGDPHHTVDDQAEDGQRRAAHDTDEEG